MAYLDSLDRANSLIVAITLFAALVAATQVGFWTGSRARRDGQSGTSEAMTIQASVLGLLALLLGFSFSMAMNRYDVRKKLVVEEANDIGTTYLRAGMLKSPYGTTIRRLLRRYVDARLELADPDVDNDLIPKVLKQTDDLQEQLWLQATAYVNYDSRPVPTGLFVTSLNQVIDDHARRMAAYENQVPEPIFTALYIVAVLAMGLTGRVCGLADNRQLMPTVTAALLIALVIFTINDLDRPRHGFIRVSQKSMMSLRESIDRKP